MSAEFPRAQMELAKSAAKVTLDNALCVTYMKIPGQVWSKNNVSRQSGSLKSKTKGELFLISTLSLVNKGRHVKQLADSIEGISTLANNGNF